jgi:hypothetical protein
VHLHRRVGGLSATPRSASIADGSVVASVAAFVAPRAIALVAAVALLAGAGCAGTVRSASRAAVPVVVDESLGAFEDPHNRERFEQILGSPEMQGAIEETARAAVSGALAPGAEVRLQALTAALADTVADVLARDMRERILPATVDGVRESLGELVTPEDRRALLATIDAAVAHATAAAIRSASAELPRSLAPAMRAALVESLDSPDLRASVAGITSDATRSALLSSRDVIVELRERSEGVGPVAQLVDRVQSMLQKTIVATFAVGMLLGALLVWASAHFRRRGWGAS